LSKKLKILVLSHISDLVGGAEMSLLDTFDFWDKNYNIEPVFILRQPVKALASAITERGWNYYDLKYTFWSDAIPPQKAQDVFHDAVDNMRAIESIEEIIKNEDPDLVMTNSVVCPWAAIASLYQRKPHVWFIREYGDLDHGRVFEIGREQTFADVDITSDLVVTNSLTLADHIKKYVDKKKVTTLYTPFKVDLMRKKMAEVVKSPYSSSKSIKLVMTGTIAESKGQQEAIEAVGIVNQAGFNVEICLIGGNGPADFMSKLNNLIDKYNIDKKVHFVGHQSNPFAYIKHADIGIMASRKEAFGRVTFEYLAMGRPVIGADAGATPELVKDGYSGYLYKQGDAKSLADAIKKYAKNKKDIKKHGSNAITATKIMMSGDYGAKALFEKVQNIASKGFDKTKKVLNYSKRTMQYVIIADEAIKQTSSMSLKTVLKSKTRRKIKNAYHKVVSLRYKLRGR